MTEVKYELSCVILGHSADVKSLSTTPEGNSIISGSKDLSARLWHRDPLNGGYTPAFVYPHPHFVSSVCFIRPTPQHPAGLIATGSNDYRVRLFDPTLATPIRVLTSHSSAVTKVTPGMDTFAFLSSSFDGKALGWKSEGSQWSSVNFSGHSGAIWSVCQLPLGLVVTASADKTLCVFTKYGTLQRVLTGHTDCVQDVAVIGVELVGSVGNDSTVRVWQVYSGECLHIFQNNAHLFHSAALIRWDGFDWVTAGEGGSVKIWGEDGEKSSIQLPCDSLCTVSTLPNGDIVIGTNDGVIRVFTADPARVADKETQDKFEQELTHAYAVKIAKDLALANTKTLEIQKSDLPGREALLQRGPTDGQAAPEKTDSIGGSKGDKNEDEVTQLEAETQPKPEIAPVTNANGKQHCDEGWNPPPPQSKFFPVREFIRFELRKSSWKKDVLAFNDVLNLGENKEALTTLLNKCETAEECTADELSLLDRLLNWPRDALNPVLQSIKILIQKPSVSFHLCNLRLINFLEPLFQESPDDLGLLAVWILTNMMSTDAGQELAFQNVSRLIGYLTSLQDLEVSQIAISTLLVNIAVLVQGRKAPEAKELLLKSCETLEFRDQESTYRYLLALGTLLWDPEKRRSAAVGPFLDFLWLCSKGQVRLKELADDILQLCL